MRTECKQIYKREIFSSKMNGCIFVFMVFIVGKCLPNTVFVTFDPTSIISTTSEQFVGVTFDTGLIRVKWGEVDFRYGTLTVEVARILCASLITINNVVTFGMFEVLKFCTLNIAMYRNVNPHRHQTIYSYGLTFMQFCMHLWYFPIKQYQLLCMHIRHPVVISPIIIF